jgi:recombination DNA repair RAD52 pathway protein
MTIYNQLTEPFSPEVERQLKKGGTYLTYIPVSEVIARLNKVLGFDGWSYEIIKCERDALDPDFIVAHVRMTVYSDSNKLDIVVKDGFGGQKIKRTKQGEIVDLGDEFKGAVSDALKKAAQAIGVGLYLARSEDALMEDEAQALVVDPVLSQMWDEFVSVSKSLTDEEKKQLSTFWEEYSGGREKPTKTTANIADLEALTQKAIILKVGA